MVLLYGFYFRNIINDAEFIRLKISFSIDNMLNN